MSIVVYIVLILTIAKTSFAEIFNDSSSDDIQDTSCPAFALRSKFGDGSNMFQFVMHGILLPIVALFGFVGNLISIFIFTRREMKASINLIFTGKKLLEFNTQKTVPNFIQLRLDIGLLISVDLPVFTNSCMMCS